MRKIRKKIKKRKNKSINDIIINDISVKDIAGNPPLKKTKLKLKVDNNDIENTENDKKNIKKNKKFFLNINNSATKDTYGEIKLDTADELIDSHKNNNENIERNWNEIITIKKKPKNKPLVSTNSILSSTKHNSIKSHTKKSIDLSNINKTNSSNNNKEESLNENLVKQYLKYNKHEDNFIKEYDNFRNIVKTLMKMRIKYISFSYGGYSEIHLLLNIFKLPLTSHNIKECNFCVEDKIKRDKKNGKKL